MRRMRARPSSLALALRRVVQRRPAHAHQRALLRQRQRAVPLDHPSALGPGQPRNPRRKKSRSTVSSPIFAWRSWIVASRSFDALLRAGVEHARGGGEQLPLPQAHLVGMELVAAGDRLDAVALLDRLEGHPGLELRGESPSSPGHCSASSRVREYTLTTCPKNRDHISPPPAHIQHDDPKPTAIHKKRRGTRKTPRFPFSRPGKQDRRALRPGMEGSHSSADRCGVEIIGTAVSENGPAQFVLLTFFASRSIMFGAANGGSTTRLRHLIRGGTHRPRPTSISIESNTRSHSKAGEHHKIWRFRWTTVAIPCENGP